MMTTATDGLTAKTYPVMQEHELVAPDLKIHGSLFVDVRTPSEFEEVHVPHSRNVPLADLQKSLPELHELAKSHSLVLVCRTQNRAKNAYENLVKSGITNCRILEGGITTWMASGNPVVRGRKGWSLERQTRLAAGLLVMVGVAMGVTISPWFLVFPAAAGAGLCHAGLTDSCLMGIMLGKLPSNRQKHVSNTEIEFPSTETS